MKNEILQTFRSSVDGFTAVQGFRDFLQSKLDDTIRTVNNLSDIAAISFDDVAGATAKMLSSIPEGLKTTFQDVDLVTGAFVMRVVNVRDLAYAMINDQLEVVEAFNPQIRLVVSEVISFMTSQVTACKCAIEMFSTIAENSIGGFVDSAQNLIVDYSSRLNLALGPSNSTMTAVSQQFLGMLMRSSVSIKERAMAIINFFGFGQTSNEEWDGVTNSEFADVTGVCAVNALFTGVATALSGILGQIIATIGTATRNVILSVLGVVFNIVGSAAKTLSGVNDAYDKSLLTLGKDLSLSDYGTTIVGDFRPGSDDDKPIWYPDRPTTVYDYSVRAHTTAWKASHSQDNPILVGSSILSMFRSLAQARLTYGRPVYGATGVLDTDMQARGLDPNSLGAVLAYTLYMISFDEKPTMDDSTARLVFYWVWNDPDYYCDVEEFITNRLKPTYRGILQLARFVESSLAYMCSWYDVDAYAKLPEKAYLKLRLIGAYMYAYQVNFKTVVRFQWIPIDDSVMSVVPILRYKETISDTVLCIDATASQVVTLPSLDHLTQYSDCDFGDPKDDLTFYSWILNAKLLTLTQLGLAVYSEFFPNWSFRVSALIGMLNSISYEKYGYAGNPVYTINGPGVQYGFFPSVRLTSGTISNLTLAKLATGIDSSSSPMLNMDEMMQMALHSLFSSFNASAETKAANFIPYYITPEIKRGSYSIRTDTTNAFIAAAAIATLIVAAVSMISMVAVKFMKKKTYVAQAKADYQAFENTEKNNLLGAYKLQKKANILDMLTGVLSGASASAASAASSSMSSIVIANAGAQLDQAIASELNIVGTTEVESGDVQSLLRTLVVGE